MPIQETFSLLGISFSSRISHMNHSRVSNARRDRELSFCYHDQHSIGSRHNSIVQKTNDDHIGFKGLPFDVVGERDKQTFLEKSSKAFHNFVEVPRLPDPL